MTVEVNLNQLAQMLGCSLPTAARLPVKYPDLPVIQRGEKGREWKFDGAAVLAFIEARKREEEEERAARGELLAQLTLPIGHIDRDGKPISLDEAMKSAKLRAMLREEEKETGALVPTLEVRDALSRIFRSLSNNLDAALRACQREHNIPEPIMNTLRAKFDNMRTAFVRDAGELLAEPAPAEEGFRLAAE